MHKEPKWNSDPEMRFQRQGAESEGDSEKSWTKSVTPWTFLRVQRFMVGPSQNETNRCHACHPLIADRGNPQETLSAEHGEE